MTKRYIANDRRWKKFRTTWESYSYNFRRQCSELARGSPKTKPPHPHLQCCCSCFGRLGRMEEISHHPRIQEKGRCLATTLKRRGCGGIGQTPQLHISFQGSRVVRNFFHRPTRLVPTSTNSCCNLFVSSYRAFLRGHGFINFER